jgi:hypothetical protein
MARTFEELRRGSARDFERLRAIIRPNLGSHKRTRLRRAGCGESETLLHDEVAKRHADMLREDYRKRLERLTRSEAQDRLRFLTVLHSVVRLDRKAVMRAVGGMEAALRRVFDGSGAWALGAVEVEVVNIALLRRIGSLSDDEARKLNVLEKIREPGASAGSLVAGAHRDSGVLVHFHGIVDLVSNWLLCEERLRDRAKRVASWQRSPYQVELKRLFKDRAVLKNVRDIASYLTKGGNEQLRYSAGFGRDLDEDLDAKIWRAGTGRADKGGKTVEDERGLTVGEIVFLDEIWRELMGRKRDKRGYLVWLG